MDSYRSARSQPALDLDSALSLRDVGVEKKLEHFISKLFDWLLQ